MESAESSEALYDGASTIFSPDGRLFQVEYAREAIKKGSTTIGLKYKDGVLLITSRFTPSNLIATDDTDKIAQIDDHIGCAFSGLVADARLLVDLARDESQINKIRYDEQMPIKALVDAICELKHLYTQFDGVRPFGVALMIAGVDNTGKHLFLTDPSGAFLEYKAACEGKGSAKVLQYFNTHYTPEFSLSEAVNFAFDALQKSTKKKIGVENLEIAVVDGRKQFRKLSYAEIQSLIKNN
ncbi:MAG: archaeal proteasome endopeptidase complex subunit alpha [Candidatus Thermoplasmatota archaeon]